MKLRSRPTLFATPIALTLSVVLALAASAQVATLVDPDESPQPENQAAEPVLGSEDREEAVLAFAQCMRDNGIDMADPDLGEGAGGRVLGLGPGGGERQIDRFGEGFLEARDACADILAAAAPEIDPEAQQESLERQLLLAQCIREHGYPEYPDPTVDANGRIERNGRQAFDELGIDFRSESFQEVISACRDQGGLGRGLGFAGGPDSGGS